jgi:hypothetical protein
VKGKGDVDRSSIVIENERQLKAAQSWLEYWKQQAADGEQSWLGGENAREAVMRYRAAIAEYERRQAEGGAEDLNSGPGS